MRYIKTKITNLTTKIGKNFPEEGDLLGFAGVTRKIITDSLSQSYELVDLLDKFGDTFEIILFKRRANKLLDDINNYLRENREDQSEEDFNNFLYLLADIHYLAQSTYILLSKEPIRLDILLEESRKQLNDSNELVNKMSPQIKGLETLYAKSQAAIEEILKKQNDSTTNFNAITQALGKISANKKLSDKSLETIQSYEDSISRIKNEIISKDEKSTALINRLELNLNETESLKNQNLELTNALQTNITTNDKFLLQIQQTIEDSNRMGMAGSFKRRKDELKVAYWGWSAATILTIIGLIVISYLVFSRLADKPFELNYLLLRLPIFASCVWLGWFCARQFGFTSRIREDYSYKYAVSMAFEGYKKEARETNMELLNELIALTVYNISKNPLSIYETSTNHGTPFNELITKFFEKRRNQKNRNVKVSKEGTEDDSMTEDELTA